jgi:hypothetical protein
MKPKFVLEKKILENSIIRQSGIEVDRLLSIDCVTIPPNDHSVLSKFDHPLHLEIYNYILSIGPSKGKYLHKYTTIEYELCRKFQLHYKSDVAGLINLIETYFVEELIGVQNIYDIEYLRVPLQYRLPDSIPILSHEMFRARLFTTFLHHVYNIPTSCLTFHTVERLGNPPPSLLTWRCPIRVHVSAGAYLLYGKLGEIRIIVVFDFGKKHKNN